LNMEKEFITELRRIVNDGIWAVLYPLCNEANMAKFDAQMRAKGHRPEDPRWK